jgi:SAM-dependent methyltransferase
MVSAERASWVADSVDMSRPNAARMYDCFLGGAYNFEADRQAAQAVLAVAPDVEDAAHANRQFLGRAVRYALGRGIRQFLDLGCGIPTVGNVHEIADAADPAARVLYVDSDRVVVAHARALLVDTDTAAAIEADLRDVADILGHEQTRRLIDFDQPVAVLLVSVLHFVPGPADELAGVVRELLRPAAPGSLLVISHASQVATTAQTEAVRRLYGRTPTPLHLRSPGEIRALFGGLDLVAPRPYMAAPAGLVPVAEWRADPGDRLPPDKAASPFLTGFLAGVAHQPIPLRVDAGSGTGAVSVGLRPRNDARFSDTFRARGGPGRPAGRTESRQAPRIGRSSW